MAQDLVDLSLRALGDHAVSHVSALLNEAPDSSATFRARADYQHQMVAILGRLLSISSPLLPQPSVFVDYEAWIRIMVKTDDALEAAWAEGIGQVASLSGRGRVTRNSAQRYTRLLTIPEDHRAILAATALPFGV
jgi:hypothetical protein